MHQPDIRWQQRFANYQRALSQLKKFIDKGDLNELEQTGLIKAFEFTHELAWNVMKDYFEYQGNTTITGSRDATREAFQKNLVADGENWMEMIKSRNMSSHTYNPETANAIGKLVLEVYFQLFQQFAQRMQGLADAN
jgi:nucleotidyltransferase substrate binding protein (TIGR01987 family)